IDELCSVVARVVGKDKLTKDESDAIFLVGDGSKIAGLEMTEFVRACAKANDTIDKCMQNIKATGDFYLQDLIDAVNLMFAKNELVGTVKAFCDMSDVDLSGNVADGAQALTALLRIYYSPQFCGNADNVIAFVEHMQKLGEPIATLTLSVVRKLKAFGAAHFANRYTRLPWLTTICGARSFAKQARDRAVIGAAIGYDGILFGKNALRLDRFFEPIEEGKVSVSPERFVDLFLHSFYAIAIEHKLKTLGAKRNGLSKNAELALKSFENAENEIREYNAAKIENLCMARIDPQDDDFDFLAIDKGINMSLRMLFRQHADAILKLKKCFIMSPSTASVLFRGDAYENFDVVIVDEASQMEPVELLPVLFRSKQCVLVGDEFQMPPLAHFKVKNRKRIIDTDSELTLDTDISALSLALGNLAFDAEELLCHYRSKTEALIEFSQRLFYPYMRTFPATVPITEDLGFTDILTENGYCEDGVNTIEAQTAVEKLKEHFDRYYNEKTHVLSMSVGVVAFGEAQIKHIQKLVDSDAELRRRIDDAYAHFCDVPDKLLFFRTIESVQGQETDHLILSITYGRDKNGNIKLAFGELNRDATGKNIFNVAVTRAKCRITVIHSVTPEQMSGNPRIAFIRDYLSVARRYSEAGIGQFKSNAPEKGGSFVKAVADYIESLGISRERIIINYGVTDGSVRIPIAILSKSLDTAEYGIWCEYPVMKKYDFYDYNVRYVSSLIGRGWKLYKVYAHDWLDNAEAEKAALKKAVEKHVTM
ncbi:MAG: DNA2/NAM7 family helicase, partial [Clostridiales bacterium]|nr:DNA2/NAM7 family helicase [Clostridiales bacterium]